MKSKLVATKNTARVLVKRRKPEKLPHGKEYFFKADEKAGKLCQEFGGKQYTINNKLVTIFSLNVAMARPMSL
jgi:hypothetical protein